MDPTPLLDSATTDFYRGAMRALKAADVPFLVGGAYGLRCYTGVTRHSKDFDIFVRQADVHRALAVLAEYGCDTEIAFPHWLGKARKGTDFLDVIYGSGNGVAMVDDLWFEHAVTDEVLGVEVELVPPEEMIWSKAFIMERERFDGADVAHLFHARAPTLDWPRLLARFDRRWRVLFVHLVLFGFIYPGERHKIPAVVMADLLGRLEAEVLAAAEMEDELLCQGTILSREQYLPDLARGYQDARLREDVSMTAQDITIWTIAAFIDG
ncbi:MAG TPA: hypothetical protein VKZ63_04805, partial [Kofleriaceae bacterium]|nr:hypothetical protein [Kofleriaceae bacterium]